MHRWLQLAPVDESCFLSNLCSLLKEGGTCSSKNTRRALHNNLLDVILPLFYVLGTLVDFSFYFLDFSQRVFLSGSQGRSCLCLLRHSSLLSGPGSRRGGVMRRWGTCYVNLGGKPRTYLGKCPFLPSYTHFFIRILITNWEFPVLPVS